MPNITTVKFDDINEPVLLAEADDLLNDVPKILSSWKFETGTVEEVNFDGLVSVTGKNNKYCLRSPRIEGEDCRAHRVDAICGLILEIIWEYLASSHELLCLHGAAAKFGDGLVVFPSTYRAGKSILSACLAHAGLQIFTDDILPVSSTQDGQFGLANGIQPRLRMPLPIDKLTEEETKFITSDIAAKSNRYCYLNLNSSELAPRGTRSSIRSFILIDRLEGQSAQLLPINTAEMLKAVVWQNFARQMESPVILHHLKQLVESTEKYRLVYDRPGDAVALLKAKFLGGVQPDRQREQISKQTNLAKPPHVFLEEDKTSNWLQQLPAVIEETVDGQSFLCGSNGQSIHYLNPVASAIWRLLTKPITEENILEVLSSAFPDVPAQQLSQDTDQLLTSLERKRLIRRVRCS